MGQSCCTDSTAVPLHFVDFAFSEDEDYVGKPQFSVGINSACNLQGGLDLNSCCGDKRPTLEVIQRPPGFSSSKSVELENLEKFQEPCNHGKASQPQQKNLEKNNNHKVYMNGKRGAKRLADAAKNGLTESTGKKVLMSDTTLEKHENICDE